MNIKLISWNVNGIRAVINKGFYDFVEKYNPDILCLQETKAHPSQVDCMLPQYENHYWNSAEKKGYSGTAIFSKIKPISVTNGDNLMEDKEGRIIIAEFEKFYLINVYTPNSKRELERLEYRQDWDKRFLKMCKDFEKKKPVIICGDLNVAHKEIDLARPKTNTRSAGFTDEERVGMNNYINKGFLDTFREFNQEGGNYSWWSYMFKSRERNVGWRIDYFLASKSLKNKLKNAKILQEVHGSDHCPVTLELEKDL